MHLGQGDRSSLGYHCVRWPAAATAGYFFLDWVLKEQGLLYTRIGDDWH